VQHPWYPIEAIHSWCVASQPYEPAPGGPSQRLESSSKRGSAADCRCRCRHHTGTRRVREQLWVCIPITALYLVLIFGGQAYMRDRPAWDVRRSLICWNWLCSIFSLIGALRVVPHALSVPLPLPPRKWSTVLPPSRVIPASKVVDH